MPSSAWPELPYAAWKDTLETLQLWTQIAGKVRLSLSPWLNHSWHVTLYVSARGLTTGPIAVNGRHWGGLRLAYRFLGTEKIAARFLSGLVSVRWTGGAGSSHR